MDKRRKIVLDAKRQILDIVRLKMSNDTFEKVIEEVIEKALTMHGVGSCLSDTSTFTVSDETGDSKIQLEVPKDSRQKYTIGWNNGSYKFTVED